MTCKNSTKETAEYLARTVSFVLLRVSALIADGMAYHHHCGL